MELYFADIHSPERASLSKEESRHCIRVMRHRAGDEIIVSDGHGCAWKATITGTDDQVELMLADKLPEFGEPPIRVHLICSPLRLKDRFEWMLEKAVELGVEQIIPIQFDHTEKYKAHVKRPRAEKILETAAKQSLRSRIPQLASVQAWSEYLQDSPEPTEHQFIARADAMEEMGKAIPRLQPRALIRIAIGPEGDFSDHEMERAKDHGWTAVHLGQQRLRSETAAIYALSVVKMLQGY